MTLTEQALVGYCYSSTYHAEYIVECERVQYEDYTHRAHPEYTYTTEKVPEHRTVPTA